MNHSEPTYANQLFHARKLLAEKGFHALNNPHAMTGRLCRCGSCFCCAAAQVLRETCARPCCGHTAADHERENGPCNVKHENGTHCVCYQFEKWGSR